ncbi:MAG: polyprenyl synthetase family protein [Methanobrevibacter sp.]|nr:polyprenyl synthetase family protein [Bacteroidales bacterium]MBR7050669.1 polyprenyl synthetase family protein [Methanobrevibacter sp.]
MDYLSLIKKPIDHDLSDFIRLFDESLSHTDGLLSDTLQHIRKRGGKRMRPILTLLVAKNYGEVNSTTQQAALGLELLHTASLVHDDVVDESTERRGQPSVNASFNNKVAVLVGDYILSTALYHVSLTSNDEIITSLAQLGRTLSSGELLQMNNFREQGISEEVYYEVISKKTASLFATCAQNGALSVGASADEVNAARDFGHAIGMIFQIRDDIFDYFDSKEIGKPTGNDMAEGKLTLPIIYALKNYGYDSMLNLARKVKNGSINHDEIAVLVDFAKERGGIDYAEQKMNEFSEKAQQYIDFHVKQSEVREALSNYLSFVALRDK